MTTPLWGHNWPPGVSATNQELAVAMYIYIALEHHSQGFVITYLLYSKA